MPAMPVAPPAPNRTTPSTFSQRMDDFLAWLAGPLFSTYGYPTGVGLGGSVVQGGSRFGGVTLNKVAGDITIFSAAGSSTPFTFTVTNSQMDVKDNIVLSQESGSNKYALFVTAKANGSFAISGYSLLGTATDSPVIHFDILKSTAT